MLDFTRAQWGARPAAYVNGLDWGKVAHLIVHYPGSTGTIGTDVAELGRWLRGWQDYHMDVKGWSDLAYNVAVDQLGRVWEGRGWDRRDGATAGMGGVSFSILAMVGNTQQPSDAMKATILRLFAEGNRRAPAARRGWHSAYSSTSCPGDALRNWGKAGWPAPADPLVAVTPAPVPKPAPAVPDWPLDNGCHSHGRNAYFGPREPLTRVQSVSGYYTHGADLRRWQQRMADRGWRITPTGHYDDATARVATAFQREKDLPADGKVGPATWMAAWTSPVT